MTIQEQAGAALASAGERLAEAEAAVRDAIAGLNGAIDLAHATGVDPEAVHGLVTVRASLGVLGDGYLAQEIRAWDASYDPDRPQSSGPGEFRDLHARPRPPARSGPVTSQAAAAEALTRAGVQLAQAESDLDRAFGLFDDAADFAQHVGVPRAAVHGLVTARASLGALGSDYLAEEIKAWDAAVGGLAEVRACHSVPPGFWELDLRAHAAKGTGGYPAAAAIWQLAHGLLPAGHVMRDDLARMITSLRIAARTGQSVTRDGRLVTSRAAVIPGETAAEVGKPVAAPDQPAGQAARLAATAFPAQKPAAALVPEKLRAVAGKTAARLARRRTS